MPLLPSHPRRRGNVTVLTALLLVFIMACVAFAVDLGYIALVHAQLQNAADSAALAGASQLTDPALLGGTPNLTTAQASASANARAQAQAFAADNYGGGVPLTLNANRGNAPGGDIVVGYMENPSRLTSPFTPIAVGSPSFPNAVQVTVHRDAVRNGSLSLFFARALGDPTWDLQATSTAAYQGGVVGFKFQNGYTGPCKLLPFTMQVDYWHQLVAGTTGDNWTRTGPTATLPPPNNVTQGPDRIHEGNLFPLSNDLSAGNFGMIDLGAPANGTPVYRNWIVNGPSAADLAYFSPANGYPNGLRIDPKTGGIPMHGTPGVHAAMQPDLISIIGQGRIIPLYSTVAGNGDNAEYTVVAFVGCTVLDVNLRGALTDKHVTIQPCFVIEPTAVTGPANGSFAGQYIVKPLGLVR
jgi:Flp pilus assembly protein TadG